MFRNYNLKNFNIRLASATIAITIFGIIVIGSANEGYQTRQLQGLIIGLVAMVIASVFSYTFLMSHYIISYVTAIALLVYVLIFGYTSYGATRWIDVGFTRFQPSEFAKIFLIIFFASYLMNYKEELNEKKRLAITAGLCILPLILILMEPDLSTTIVTFFMLACMIYYAGLSYKIVGVSLGAGIFIVIMVIAQVLRNSGGLLLGYQGERILAWLRPEEYPQISYQQQNSIMAIGSGRIFGKGLNNNAVDSVKNGNYISEGQTDFIFAIVGEELGLIGCVLLIGLMLFISYECIRTSKKAKDFSGELICIGMGCLIAFQSFVNIGVVTGLLPNTGLTLPFVSYGLTSLVALFGGVGMVLNVSLQARKH